MELGWGARIAKPCTTTAFLPTSTAVLGGLSPSVLVPANVPKPHFSAPAWCQTSVVGAGGHDLKVQEDVLTPCNFLSPFLFLHTLEGIVLLPLDFISIPSCVTLVWKWDFYDSCCRQALMAVFSPHIRGRWSLQHAWSGVKHCLPHAVEVDASP